MRSSMPDLRRAMGELLPPRAHGRCDRCQRHTTEAEGAVLDASAMYEKCGQRMCCLPPKPSCAASAMTARVAS